MTRECNARAFIGLYDGERSHVAIQYAINNYDMHNLCIITSADRRDGLFWQEVLRDIGYNGKVTIDSWQRIRQYENVDNAFFIFDGNVVRNNSTWARSFLKIAKKNSWIVTCDCFDNWMDLSNIFVACGFYKNRTEFIRKHVRFEPWCRYPKIKEYVNVDRLFDNLKKIYIKPQIDRGRLDE